MNLHAQNMLSIVRLIVNMIEMRHIMNLISARHLMKISKYARFDSQHI